LMSQRPPPGFDERVRVTHIHLSEDTTQGLDVEQAVDLAVYVLAAAIHEYVRFRGGSAQMFRSSNKNAAGVLASTSYASTVQARIRREKLSMTAWT